MLLIVRENVYSYLRGRERGWLKADNDERKNVDGKELRNYHKGMTK